jgi:predicted ATP-grasp superfamily ATP-dependent carboligase
LVSILILGARAPISLELARSFKENGYRVIIADSILLPVARWSNKKDRYYKLPSPRFSTNAFISTVKEIIREEKVTDIIPTSEEIFYISKYRDELACKVWVSDFELMDELHNKLRFQLLFKEYFTLPRTMLLSEFSDWDNACNYVFKPVYSRFGSSVIIGKKVKPGFWKRNELSGWIAQEYIKGKEMCAYSIWDNGKLKAFVSYLPVYRVGSGSSVFFKPEDNQDVFEKIRTFGESVNFTGQLSFDIIIDSNELAWFIECNPRGTSGAHLINDRLARSFFGDELIVVSSKLEYSIKSALAFMHPLKVFTGKVRESVDVIYRNDDKRPFFFQILSYIEIIWIKIKKRSTIVEATTQDIEWNGKESDDSDRRISNH